MIDTALARFWELRQHALRKPPATAELLVWLSVLAAHPDTRPDELQVRLIDLPALSTLVKDRDDRSLLEQAP